MRGNPSRSAVRRFAAVLVAAALLPVAGVRADDGFDEAARGVQKAMGERDPGALADAVVRLGDHDGVPATRLLLSVAARPDAHALVVETCLSMLRRQKADEVGALIARECEAARGAKRLLLLEAAGVVGATGVEETLLAALENADPRVRTAATVAAGARRERTPALRVGLERALRDDVPQVRSAAVAALARGEVTGGLPLVLLLTRERGRLFGDAWSALRRLSGERFAAEPEAWADWWRTLPGEGSWRFDAPPPEPPAPSVVLAGLPTWSRRIAFVLDLSEGMADRPGYRPEEILPKGVREKGGEALARWMKVETRLDHAAALLADAIEGLPADASFDVIFGGESVNAVFRGMEAVTASSKERAVSRLRGLNAKGRQDLLGVLRQAVSGPARDPADEDAHVHGADTVVYLGTALPSFGAETDSRRILATVRRWNVTRQVAFLCIGVGTHDAGLLADLGSMEPRGGASAVP